MKAIVQTGYGEPEMLVERDVDTPTPGEGEVLVRVAGCGVCYRDTLVRRGHMKARLPVIPGHELAGQVVEVGEGVEGLNKGDSVASLIYTFPRNCKRGEENLCRGNQWLGEDRDGCYAEYVSLPYWSLVKIGAHGEAPLESYSFAACIVGTAYRALKQRAKAVEGETVLVTGAGGGLGLHSVQVARALGLRVIAVTRSEEKARILESLGVDHVVVYGSEGFSQEVKKLTDGDGADIVLENVGGPTLDQSLRSVRRGGRVILTGNVDPRPQQVLLGLVILKEAGVLGSLNSTLRDLEEAVRLLSSGAVKPVYKSIPLSVDEVRQAHSLLEAGRAHGRIVIVP